MVKLSCPETINHAPKKGVVTYMIPYHQLTLADVLQKLRNYLNPINLNS